MGGADTFAPVRVAVLVSGTGSILDSMIAGGVPVTLVVADRPCRALERAAEAGVPAELVERDRFDVGFDRDGYSDRIADVLDEHRIDLVAMAGFGTILSAPAHERYGGRILNTHPALLPSFPGWHAVQAALDHGVKVTGCTVHVAGLEVDTGPILAQAAVEVLPGDDAESLQERIKELERVLYPATLRAIVDGEILLPGLAERA